MCFMRAYVFVCAFLLAALYRVQPPYAFVKRTMETGAGWWPGRHCQFFEFNCFEQAYAEADQLLKEKEKEATRKE